MDLLRQENSGSINGFMVNEIMSYHEPFFDREGDDYEEKNS